MHKPFTFSMSKKYAKFLVGALFLTGAVKKSQVKIWEVKGLTEYFTTWHVVVPNTKIVRATWAGFIAGKSHSYTTNFPIPSNAKLTQG